ncbi:predicted protein [Postia placenta Mad-698-R]|uniref:Shugoshin C-terminal domain-containing protein n=1 Tax=Postia placenta MAD-698-R-SB12 TaxID=670580 RepID=A0A1X6MIW3_9APHY|nr:hypothetical protein POSPLADRAFT_1160216 [Postia placenta MAD-698-R-SB12]EED78818.1 predicted protein [Postia placenta Mad-698-R]OSX56310.1 hypothetical protein POSPLADRAFT_1160216 [Postia placenta MAD-698-R-SB12]
MSRRQSRVSVDSRQNDTLLEFENFKKKFLLANKHITKLNSTLSVRIEELNEQISTLYVENLRLRASEIALASQLKRERERSRKIITDAEAATHSLIKHLGHIRKSFNAPHGRESGSDEQLPPLPRAKRPVLDPNATPLPNRIARAPTVPGIFEDDEVNVSSPEDPDADVDDGEKSPTRVRHRTTKSRSVDSRIPTRVSPTPAEQTVEIDFEDQLDRIGKRKPTRRRSGLLTSMSITTVIPSGISTEVIHPRPPSPAFGSPLRREAGLAEEEEEAIVENGEEQEVEVILQSAARRERKERRRERESASSDRTRERKRPRDLDEPPPLVGGSKFKLKDVTNSQPREFVPDRGAQLLINTGAKVFIQPAADALAHATVLEPSAATAGARARGRADWGPGSATGMKRKKSRVHVLPDDEEESEGTQADAEYGGRTGTGWISAEGRRRSVHSGSSLRRLEGDDFRRHSMAV